MAGVHRLLDRAERPADRLGQAGLAAERRDVQADGLQDVAELVGHLARELAESGQVLRLAEDGAGVPELAVPLVELPRPLV